MQICMHSSCKEYLDDLDVYIMYPTMQCFFSVAIECQNTENNCYIVLHKNP